MTKATPQHEQPEDVRPLTRRLEWDEARQCFSLRYVSSWAGRMRCECLFGLEQPALGAALALTLPLTLPILAGTLLLNSSRVPSELCLFAWGLSDSTPRISAQARWPEVKRINLRSHDLFVSWKSPANPAMPGCYFPHECFADEDEALFCYQTLLALWQSRGESWSMARSRLIARQTLRSAHRAPDPFADSAANDATSDPFA